MATRRPTGPFPVLITAAASVLVIGLAGCANTQPAGPVSGTGSTAAPSSARAVSSGTAAPSTSASPSNDVVLTEAALDLVVRGEDYPTEYWLLFVSEREFTDRCMRAHGFDQPSKEREPRTDDPWHPNLQERQRHGYRIGEPAQPSVERTKLPAAEQARSDELMSGDPKRTQTLALISGPKVTFATTGCIAEGRRALYGDVMTAARVAYLSQEAYITVQRLRIKDPAVTAALRAWAACMHGRGYDYATPDVARQGVGERYDSGSSAERNTAPAFEKQVAVADGTCALQVGLPQTVVRVGRTYAASLPAAQRQELNQVAELRDAALRRARDLTDPAGGSSEG